MTAPNRAPGTSWTMRPLGKWPNGFVLTAEGDRIEVLFVKADAAIPQGLEMSRDDARLLARRINQCLDDTAKQ